MIKWQVGGGDASYKGFGGTMGGENKSGSSERRQIGRVGGGHDSS